MGEIHDLRCSKCGYGIKAYLGIGMMYAPHMIFGENDPSLPDLIQDDKITSQALAKIKSGVNAKDNYEHALYACPEDNYLFNKFYFELDDGSKPTYQCPYCQTTLQRVTFAKATGGVTKLKFVENPDSLWNCPHCGNSTLNEVAFANWD